MKDSKSYARKRTYLQNFGRFVDKSEAIYYLAQILTSMQPPGPPPDCLPLKISVLMMFLCKFSLTKLCNEIIFVKKLVRNVI